MKKLLLILGFTSHLLANYVAGVVSCEHKSGDGSTYFLVKGHGIHLQSVTSKNVLENFLHSKYSAAITHYCKEPNNLEHISLLSRSSWVKINKKFVNIVEKYEKEDSAKKLIIIKNGYDEANWK